jgi:hypothetical protein
MDSDATERHNREHHGPIDDKYLQVLIQLRKLGLLKEEDIKNYATGSDFGSWLNGIRLH